jgi:hypothetical protein
LGPAPDAKNIEIAVLRHQLMVLRRQVARPSYSPQDRLEVAILARLLPREQLRAFLVTLATLTVAPRAGVPSLDLPVLSAGPDAARLTRVDLVMRMARENPRRGYLRIVEGSVANSASGLRRRRRGRRPGEG